MPPKIPTSNSKVLLSSNAFEPHKGNCWVGCVYIEFGWGGGGGEETSDKTNFSAIIILHFFNPPNNH